MATIVCPECGKEFEDEILCCPHCGTAQIPQMSKAQLRVANMHARGGPMVACFLGGLVGMAVGGVYCFLVTTFGSPSMASGAGWGWGMCGFGGVAIGFIVHLLRLRRRKRS